VYLRSTINSATSQVTASALTARTDASISATAGAISKTLPSLFKSSASISKVAHSRLKSLRSRSARLQYRAENLRYQAKHLSISNEAFSIENEASSLSRDDSWVSREAPGIRSEESAIAKGLSSNREGIGFDLEVGFVARERASRLMLQKSAKCRLSRNRTCLRHASDVPYAARQRRPLSQGVRIPSQRRRWYMAVTRMRYRVRQARAMARRTRRTSRVER
jgi:hypothetical protein